MWQMLSQLAADETNYSTQLHPMRFDCLLRKLISVNVSIHQILVTLEPACAPNDSDPFEAQLFP
jgi:hypothetical protein